MKAQLRAWRAALRQLLRRQRPAGIDVAFDPTPLFFRKLRGVPRAAAVALFEARLLPSERAAALAVYDLAQDSSESAFVTGLSQLDAATLRALPVELPLASPTYFQDAAAAHERTATLLRGKRVVLTGPAVHGLGLDAGAAIDGFDLVARLNFQWPVASALVPHLGRRCDLLFHCCNGDYPVESLDTPALAEVKSAFLEQGVQSARFKRLCREHGVPVQYVSAIYDAVARRIGAPPTTGLAAVHHLLSYPIRELHLVGMTFGLTPYYAGYRGHGAAKFEASQATGALWKHEIAAEVVAVRGLLRSDPRLTLDPVASRLINR